MVYQEGGPVFGDADDFSIGHELTNHTVNNDDARLLLALLAAGADAEVRSTAGWTPLHVAAGFDRALAISILVRNRANVNTIDEDGDSPLLTASALGYSDAVQQLLVSGANPRFSSASVCLAVTFVVHGLIAISSRATRLCMLRPRAVSWMSSRC